jgi:Putative zinc-finger
MRHFGGPVTPFGGRNASPGDNDEYALWDAAYVLGSLSSAERSEYEAHLRTCPSCRQAVAELGCMPALLSRLDGADVAAIDEGGPNGSAPTMRPQVLNSLQAKVSHRRRLSRMVLSTVAAAAAAVLVIGTFIAMRPSGLIPGPTPPAAEESGLTMTPVMSSELSATVTLSSYSWGTRIDMNCTYGVDNSDHERDSQADDKLAMVVVGRDGSRSQVATWVALPGVTASLDGSISAPVGQIAAIQVVSTATQDVLLQRNL